MYTGKRVMGTADGKRQGLDHFDAKRFYQDLEDCLRLQITPEEMAWERVATRSEQAEVVLNLSCGVQATPHVMLTQIALFEALGVDFVATAGTKFCCGRPMGVAGRQAAGDKVGQRSVARLASWRPTTNVQCCGSCLVEYQHHVEVIRTETGSAPFEVVHITEFLLAKLRELGGDTPWDPPRRDKPLRVLLHAEGAEVHPTKEDARRAVIDTLSLIPGIEFAGMVENPSIGQPCASKARPGASDSVGHTAFSDLTAVEYRIAQAELASQARAAGAGAIVTHHHKCHREWSKFGSPRLPVIHYQSLIAEALGINIPDRFHALWRLGDVEQVLAQSRPQWQSWDLAEEDARELVKRFFVPAYSANVQDCPCEATCDIRSATCPVDQLATPGSAD